MRKSQRSPQKSWSQRICHHGLQIQVSCSADCCSTCKKKSVNNYNLSSGMGKMLICTPSFRHYSLTTGVLAWSLYIMQGDNNKRFLLIWLVLPSQPMSTQLLWVRAVGSWSMGWFSEIGPWQRIHAKDVWWGVQHPHCCHPRPIQDCLGFLCWSFCSG